MASKTGKPKKAVAKTKKAPAKPKAVKLETPASDAPLEEWTAFYKAGGYPKKKPASGPYTNVGGYWIHARQPRPGMAEKPSKAKTKTDAASKAPYSKGALERAYRTNGLAWMEKLHARIADVIEGMEAWEAEASYRADVEAWEEARKAAVKDLKRIYGDSYSDDDLKRWDAANPKPAKP